MTWCALSSRSASPSRPAGLPDMALMLSDALVVFDHLKHTVTILVNADLEAEPDVERAYERPRATIAEMRRALAGPVPRRAGAAGRGMARAECPSSRSNMPREQFEGDGRADRRVHLRRRRLPGRALAALVRAGAGGGVLDLPRPARGQPQPLHVLPRLRRLPGGRRQPRAAAHRQRAPRLAPARSPAPARAAPAPRRTAASPPSCSPTRRSAPST